MLVEELRKRTKRRQDHIAFVQENAHLSYGDLWKAVNQYVEILRSAGLGPRDIAVLHAPNSIELSILFLAIWDIGAIPFPVAQNQSNFLQDLLETRFSPRLILIGTSWLNVRILHPVERLYARSIGFGASFILFTNCTSRNITQQNSSEYVTAYILSSGTENEPKIIVLDQLGTIINIRSNIESLGLCENDVTLLYLPMSYTYGLIAQFLSHLYLGARIVFPPPTTNMFHTVISSLQRDSITTLFTVPMLFRQLCIIFYEFKDKGHLPSSLRLLTVGGDHIDNTYLRKALDIFDHTDVAVTYGLAEAGPRVTTYFVEDSIQHLGSVGKPIPGVNVKVVNQHGTVLPCGTVGKVVVYSPSIMKGYLFHADDNDFIPNCKIYTGDHGFLSSDGFLYVTGRSSERIQVVKQWVYFNEIKDVLYEHPDIMYVEVMKILDSEAPERITIKVVPMPGKHIDVLDLYSTLNTKLPVLSNHVVIEVLRKITGPSRWKG